MNRDFNPLSEINFYNYCVFHFLRWQILDQSECSSRCGEGYIIRRIKCMKRSQTANDYIDDKYCADLGPKPDVRISCHGMCLATHWAYTEWSEVGELYIARGTYTLNVRPHLQRVPVPLSLLSSTAMWTRTIVRFSVLRPAEVARSTEKPSVWTYTGR